MIARLIDDKFFTNSNISKKHVVRIFQLENISSQPKVNQINRVQILHAILFCPFLWTHKHTQKVELQGRQSTVFVLSLLFSGGMVLLSTDLTLSTDKDQTQIHLIISLSYRPSRFLRVITGGERETVFAVVLGTVTTDCTASAYGVKGW